MSDLTADGEPAIPVLPIRYTSHPFPPYAYVPRMHPHPFSDVKGHSHGQVAAEIDPGDVTALRQAHLWAVDLFNHGFYWESHEAWESLWHAFGRTGVRADFVKGLIKLAAAGVKAREGKPSGVQRHARRAAELFQTCAADREFLAIHEFGLSAERLEGQSRVTAEQPATIVDSTACTAKRVFSFVLEPRFV